MKFLQARAVRVCLTYKFYPSRSPGAWTRYAAANNSTPRSHK